MKILQLALGFTGKDVDGLWGQKSKTAMAKVEAKPDTLLDRLRQARETYERKYVGYRANFWQGLVNRWNSAERIAKSYPGVG